MGKELAIVLPYLFDSDLQYSLRQGWRRLQWLLRSLQLEDAEQLITVLVKLAML